MDTTAPNGRDSCPSFMVKLQKGGEICPNKSDPLFLHGGVSLCVVIVSGKQSHLEKQDQEVEGRVEGLGDVCGAGPGSSCP